jgi:biotin carboxyl carrier protein
MSGPHEVIELRMTRDGDDILLTSPDVGMFTAALLRGAALTPGMAAGVLHSLSRSVEFVVPPGAAGVITSEPPTALMSPVGYGDVLYRLDPNGASGLSTAAEDGAPTAEGDGVAVTAIQSGRIWHRPGPGEAAFCAPGDVLENGTAIYLIEVMKTFSNVPYRSTGGLPDRARVVRWLVEDGADVQQGDALLSVEPA